MFFLYCPVSLLQHWVHSTTALFRLLFFLCFAGWFSTLFFPWGVWAIFSMCSQKFVIHSCLYSTDSFSHLVRVFHFLGRRRMAAAWDWSIHTRGDIRRIRSCLLFHLGQLDWRQLRHPNARLLLFFEHSQLQLSNLISTMCSSPRISNSVKWSIGT